MLAYEADTEESLEFNEKQLSNSICYVYLFII